MSGPGRAAQCHADQRAVGRAGEAVQGGGRDAVAEVEIDGRTHVLPWAAGRRLLDVIVEAGLNPP